MTGSDPGTRGAVIPALPGHASTVLLALAMALAGCTVGPDYEPPDFTVETVPDQWRTTLETEMDADTTDLEMWWIAFNDPMLTELIRRSEFGNLDLQAAVGRVAEARAIRGVATGQYWPDIALGGAYSYQKLSENGLQGAQVGQPDDGTGEFSPSDWAGPRGPPASGGALRALNAVRIGHGVRCLEDADLVAELRERQIPLEVCPTSNVCLGVAPSFAEHPLPRLLDAGLYVTLNSIDPPMFGTTLTDEYL